MYYYYVYLHLLQYYYVLCNTIYLCISIMYYVFIGKKFVAFFPLDGIKCSAVGNY